MSDYYNILFSLNQRKLAYCYSLYQVFQSESKGKTIVRNTVFHSPVIFIQVLLLQFTIAQWLHRSCTRASRYFGTGFCWAKFKNTLIKTWFFFNISHFRSHSVILACFLYFRGSLEDKLYKTEKQKNSLKIPYLLSWHSHVLFFP